MGSVFIFQPFRVLAVYTVVYRAHSPGHGQYLSRPEHRCHVIISMSADAVILIQLLLIRVSSFQLLEYYTVSSWYRFPLRKQLVTHFMILFIYFMFVHFSGI